MGKGKRRRNHGDYRSRMRKKMFREILRDIKPFVWMMLGLVVLMWILSSRSLQPFRDTKLYDILLRSALSVPYLYFAFLHRNRPPVFGQVMVVLTALTVWMPMVLHSKKTLMILNLILLYCDLGAALWHRIFDKRWHAVLCVAAFDMALAVLTNIGMWMNTIHGFPFWLPSLIVGIAAAWVCFQLLLSRYVELKDDRLSERIAVVFATFFLGFFLIWGSCVCANYALDTSRGKTYYTVLEDKKISTGKSTSYYLYVTVEGEQISFEITQSEYYQTEIGDKYMVELYQGFLGEPYYTIRKDE